MKKYLLIASMAFTTGLFAQIPNGDFESWTDMGSYNDPDNWATLNAFTDILSTYTATQGSPGVSGDYYLKLTSKNVLGVGVVPGIAVSGEIDMVTYTATGGFAYANRPTALTGSWQYMAFGSDQGYVAGALTKWNAAGSTRDTIAVIYYPLPGMEMSWTDFSLDWIYLSPATPDSCLIVFSSSGIAPVNNSYVYLDNLGFDGEATTGISDHTADQYAVYPNPASDHIEIMQNGNASDVQEIFIADMTGQIVYRTDAFVQSVDVAELPAGQYIVGIISNNKQQHYTIVKE